MTATIQKPCDACRPAGEQPATLDPETFCEYHKSQYQYAQQQQVDEAEEGVRLTLPKSGEVE